MSYPNRDVFKKNENTLDSITRFTLEIWFTVVRKYKLEREIKILTWVAYDSKFKPGAMDSSFEQWMNKGITVLCRVTDRGQIKRFQSLQRQCGLEGYDQFRYF